MCVRFDQETGIVWRWSKGRGLWEADETWAKAKTDRFPGEPGAIVTVSEEHGLMIETAAWGLQPFWAKTPRFGRTNAYNARSETIAEKSTFAGPFKKGQRCLVPASAFYERDFERQIWLKLSAVNGEALICAGLFEEPNAQCPSRSFTLVTTEPNEVVAEVHDRMPVVLAPEDWDLWLKGDPAGARGLLVPCPAELLKIEDAEPIGFKRT